VVEVGEDILMELVKLVDQVVVVLLIVVQVERNNKIQVSIRNNMIAHLYKITNNVINRIKKLWHI
jgi:hypothetical protein